jgi:hypothetical protein
MPQPHFASTSSSRQELEHNLKSQKRSSKFSFSDVFSNAELEEVVNRKIEAYERKEKYMLEQLLFKLSAATLPHLPLAHSQLEEVATASLGFASSLADNIGSLADLMDYRTIYKKEFFTAELKLHLLQARCGSLEQGIASLMPFLNTVDKRVARRLKEMGFSPDNAENQPSLRNRGPPKREK